MKKNLIRVIVLATLFIGGACLPWPLKPTPTATVDDSWRPEEKPVQNLFLGGVIMYKEVRTSGLAWYGDFLLDLPGRLDRYSDLEHDLNPSVVFFLFKSDILDTISDNSNPLGGYGFELYAPGLLAQIPDYQDFEAIAVAGERVYFLIEAGVGTDMAGYLVSGVIDSTAHTITVDTTRVVHFPAQAQAENRAYEALVVVEDRILVISEVNGAGLNPSPVAYVFSLELEPLGTIPFPNIEYRITDATDADEQGRFWALNCYHSEDGDLRPVSDPLVERYGQGATHARFQHIERLVHLQYTEAGIVLVDEPPIQLKLEDYGRNWEGLVRLDERGFLLMTDEVPSTMLGFVSAP